MTNNPRSTRFDGEIKALEDLLSDPSSVDLRIPISDMFVIMCSLQFAVSDPRLTDATKETLTSLGRQLSKYVILRYPYLKDEIENGWMLTPPKK